MFNGLIYCSLNNLIFIFFLFILSFFILILTSFYPTNVITNINTNVITNINTNVITNITTNVTTNEITNVNTNINTKEHTSKLRVNNILNTFNLEELMQTKRDHYLIIEYPLIIQFILIGGITLLSSNDLITIFLSIELQSYGLYILSTLYRNSESSTSAGLTYFLLGGLSSCIILLGLSFLYINSGTTSLDGLYIIYNIITSDSNLLYYILQNNIGSPIFTLNYYQYTIQFSLVLLAVGFLFKISAAPFHS
jgi:NADH:ubiquinone oxidoreductase subunit 2 (subunit N)